MLRTLFVSILLILNADSMAGAVPGIAGSDLLERLMADYAVLESAEADYQARQDAGQLSSADQTDYRAYLEKLREQFYLDCLQLAGTDFAVLPPDVPCPEQLPAPPAAAVIDQATERTPGERTAVLEQELDAALGEFDEMLLREQARVKAATPPADAGGSGGGGRSGGAAADGAQGAGTARAGSGPARWESETGEAGEDAGDVADAGGAPGAGDVSSGSGAAPGGQGSAGGKRQTAVRGQPPGIPDGSDDDVVARQLREAAEKETDPELRKKLWEEYRKYKQGTR